MPSETQTAVDWALTQEEITLDSVSDLVDKVREYFNANSIVYTTFTYNDLIPYLPLSE